MSAATVATASTTANGFVNQNQIGATVLADYDYFIKADAGFTDTRTRVTFEALIEGFYDTSAFRGGVGSGLGVAITEASIGLTGSGTGEGFNDIGRASATTFPDVVSDADSTSFSETVVLSRLIEVETDFQIRLSASAWSTASAGLNSFGTGVGKRPKTLQPLSNLQSSMGPTRNV